MSKFIVAMQDMIETIVRFAVPVLVPYLTIIVIWLLYFIYVKKIKPIKGTRVKPNIYNNILVQLFWSLPRRIALDFLQRDPDRFDMYGLHLFCGEQGSGKTMTMVYMISELMRKYPKLKVRTNFAYSHQHGEITKWEDVISNNNGIYGQLEAFDELQNWFSSNDSKNFPPEMLTEITQERKQSKVIFGTSQVFTRVAKPIREQVMFLYEPRTLFGCFTIVRVSKPECNDDGAIENKKHHKLFCFVHTEELRNCYDTYKKIERYKKVGFKETLTPSAPIPSRP